MKNIPLLIWMEDIDPVLIERSDKYRARRTPYLRTLLIAAAILVLLTVALSAFAAWRVDTYVQAEYSDTYDGTLLHALDIVLTQDENAVSALLGEQNKKDLHSLFNALRGVKDEQENEEQQPEAHGSQGLEYRSRGDGNCSVIGIGSCKDVHVVIPERSPDGEIVVGIAENAFENNFSITKVTLPSTIRTIRDNAFAGCSKLEQINIPEGVTLIGTQAFRGCWRLTALHIPGSVSEIGERVVGMCIMLEELTVAPENLVYRGEGNCLIDKESGVLLAGCEGSVIPEGVTSIAPYAFYCMSGLRKIDIPEGVTSIGEQAFLGCTMLREVTFPSTLKSIGVQAFSECTVLQGAVFSEGLETIEMLAFEKCEKLASVRLPSSLQSIGEAAFTDCASLAEIDIPNGITTIESNTFYGCHALARVGIPDSVTVIESYAFYACRALEKIDLPDGIASVANHSFTDCASLVELTIPEGVKVIGQSAFSGASSLEKLQLPESLATIGASAFASCTALESVYIPAKVFKIGDEAFRGCLALTELTVSADNATYQSEGNCLIETGNGRLIFANAHSTVPEGVKIIGSNVFYQMEFVRFSLPDGVEEIEPMAFMYCWDMLSIVIPESVTKIDDYAFCGCTRLMRVYYTGTEEQWNQISIGQDNEYLLEAEIRFEYVRE